MSVQLAFNFDSVSVTCPVQERYHAIAPILSGNVSSFERAKQLNVSYSTVTRWLARFREDGMPGLLPGQFHREPYTPEKVVVSLLFYKSCLPGASYRELARVINKMHQVFLHHETVKALLDRYFFWRHDEFRRLVRYPIPPTNEEKRLEMVRLAKNGWSETSIAKLLETTRKTVRKWIRRSRQRAMTSQPNAVEGTDWLFDLSHAPHHPRRKVYFSAIHACLQIQKKYPAAGWFRVQGYLSRDYHMNLGQTAIKKIIKLNRRLHLVPPKPIKFIFEKEEREGPPHSLHPFEHAYIDIRYLDAKPEQTQLYSCLLLEGFSRTILAGSLTRRQDLGTVLRLYYLALLGWGRWETIISDHGSQFTAGAFAATNKRLGIKHHLNDKGHPWQNLIESQFGIRARLGEYAWSHCGSVERAVEIHRELIRDHNRLPHFAHRERNDHRHAPLEVLASRRGHETTARDLHYAFSRRNWQRRTDSSGFVRIGKWRVYVEEGLPRTPVQILFWDGQLRAEYRERVLSEYAGEYSDERRGVIRLEPGEHFETEYNTKQQELFEVGWQRDPLENTADKPLIKRRPEQAFQLKLKFETAA